MNHEEDSHSSLALHPNHLHHSPAPWRKRADICTMVLQHAPGGDRAGPQSDRLPQPTAGGPATRHARRQRMRNPRRTPIHSPGGDD